MKNKLLLLTATSVLILGATPVLGLPSPSGYGVTYGLHNVDALSVSAVSVDTTVPDTNNVEHFDGKGNAFYLLRTYPTGSTPIEVGITKGAGAYIFSYKEFYCSWIDTSNTYQYRKLGNIEPVGNWVNLLLTSVGNNTWKASVGSYSTGVSYSYNITGIPSNTTNFGRAGVETNSYNSSSQYRNGQWYGGNHLFEYADYKNTLGSWHPWVNTSSLTNSTWSGLFYIYGDTDGNLNNYARGYAKTWRYQ